MDWCLSFTVTEDRPFPVLGYAKKCESPQFSDKLDLSVGRFTSKAKDLIDREYNSKWPNQQPRFWWRNLSEVEIAGWEARANGKFNKNLSAWFSYTRLEKVNDTSNDARLDERPEYKFTSGVEFNRGRFGSLLVCEHLGAAKYVAVGGGKTMSEKIDSSTRFDLTCRYQFKSYFAIYASVENLTDAKIQSFGHVPGAPPIYESPRRGVVGMECKF